MASPILISKSLHSFSIWIVLQSIELTITSSFKCLQNPELYARPRMLLYLQSLKISLVIYLPVYFLKSIFDQPHISPSMVIFFLTLYNFLGVNSETLFVTSLKYKDGDYYTNFELVSSSHHSKYYGDSMYFKLQYLLKHSRQFKLFLKRYTGFYVLNLIIFIVTYFPSKLSTLILGFISFTTFVDKLGPFESAILVVILNFCDYYYTALILTIYSGVNNLGQDLVIPYFNEINFTISEQQQWMKSREGVLFGIALVYFGLLYLFPVFAMTIYLLAIINMGYIIPYITSIPPGHLSKLQSWCSGECVWNVNLLF